ncbi:hypothetical protein B0H17DRAFT_292798 [Mycena rosella]|uniref:Uncharacterized protein n=1 Tax=Mycena rosella TaxID=1033263 RepID=A0AAD7G7R6_MYCRO|nr:hypothetical protein B0H17DRAFT_292798 [Mycena rosella]
MDIARSHSWAVAMDYDVQQRELAALNPSHNLTGLDANALTIIAMWVAMEAVTSTSSAASSTASAGTLLGPTSVPFAPMTPPPVGLRRKLPSLAVFGVVTPDTSQGTAKSIPQRPVGPQMKRRISWQLWIQSRLTRRVALGHRRFRW